jgi:hypothetical protein
MMLYFLAVDASLTERQHYYIKRLFFLSFFLIKNLLDFIVV